MVKEIPQAAGPARKTGQTEDQAAFRTEVRRVVIRAAAQTAMAIQATVVVVRKTAAPLEDQALVLEILVALVIRAIPVTPMISRRGQVQEVQILETVVPELRQEDQRMAARKMETLAEAQEAAALLAMVVLDLVAARNLILEVARSSFLCLLSLPSVLQKRL